MVKTIASARSNAPGASERLRAPGLRHVLISSIACEPNKGSELLEGWSWVTHLSRHFRLSVITDAISRDAIETWLRAHDLPNVSFHYVGAPAWTLPLKDDPLTYYAFYILWQWRAWRVARSICARDPIALVHHVTLGSLPGPIFMQRLPAPLIIGPVGGGEMAPLPFWFGGGIHSLAYEVTRATRARMLWMDPIVQSTLRKAARIIVTTPSSSQLVPRDLRHKVAIMSSCSISMADIPPAQSSSGDGSRVYMVGRLVHWKGFHLAIRAFARASRHRPEASLTIVGDGPQRGRLLELARSEGVADRVHFTRNVPRADVLCIGRESDIFIYPSIHDAGGTSVVEAMAASKPVICLDLGGPSYTVTPACGVKVPAHTPGQAVAGLADALERLMADSDLRRRMGEAARQRVLDVFVWERRVERMLDFYHEVLGGSAINGASSASRTQTGEYRRELRGTS